MTNRTLHKILVVDDDPIIRDMMVDILEVECYPPTVARNGREAMEKLRSEDNYLVFLDLMMPVMSGFEVCEQLNADPVLRNRHVVILMSAVDNLEMASSLSIDSVLPKPFVVDDLLRVIQPYTATLHQV